MSAFLTEIWRDRLLYILVFAYVAASGLLSAELGMEDKFLPFMYISRWIIFLCLLSAVYIAGLTVRGLRSPEGLCATFTAGLPCFVAGILLCLLLALLHGTYTSAKTIVPDLYPFRFDVLLADIDHSIHGADPWRLLTWLSPVVDLVQILYSIVWLLLVVFVTTLATTLSPSRELRTHYAWTFTLCWILLGNVMSSLTLAAGPAYYSKVTGSGRFDGLTGYLAQHDGPFSAHHIQNALWTAYSEHSVGLASGISAFPSMHMSMVTLFTLYGFKISKAVGFAFALYAFVILLGSVHLGWHYAVDGYGSILATLAIWKVVAWGIHGFPFKNNGRWEAGVEEARA